MTLEEKMVELEDVLDLGRDEFNEDTVLDEIETWDSVAVLSFIAVMNEHFNKFPNAREIRAYKTIGDLLNAMN